MAKHLALIDLGSNSVRMVIMALHRDGSYKLVDEIKESVRLSENMGPEKTLKPPAIHRTIETLKLFRKLCEANRIGQVISVATAAVRQAVNGKEFLDRLEKETGFHFRVLTGEEEARYVYLGVINSLELRDGLIMDIGGGSVELVLFRDRILKEAVSLPFGAVTLSEGFQVKDRAAPEQLDKLEAFLEEAFRKVKWLDEANGLPLIGLGGTIRNLGKMDRKRKHYSLDITHNYLLAPADVEEIYQGMRRSSLEERRKIPGLSRDRADIIVGGLAAVRQVIRRSKARELVVSGSGLREGLFFDYLLQRENKELIDDVLRHSVENLMKLYNVLELHARHVAGLSLSLFDQLAELHGCDRDFRTLLEVSALLHDVGIAISYYDHHRHTFYLISNSRIGGFSHREILLCAYLAAAHRNGQIKDGQSRHKDILSAGDWEKVRRLGVILALAEALDRSEGGTVGRVNVTVKAKQVILRTESPQGAELEIAEAMRLAPLFKKTYKKELIIE